MIKIRAFIDGWNDRKHPFIWTKTADDILDRINRKGFQRRTTRPALGFFCKAALAEYMK